MTYFYIFPGTSLSDAGEMCERYWEPTKQRIVLRETSSTCELQGVGVAAVQRLTDQLLGAKSTKEIQTVNLFTYLTSVRNSWTVTFIETSVVTLPLLQ